MSTPANESPAHDVAAQFYGSSDPETAPPEDVTATPTKDDASDAADPADVLFGSPEALVSSYAPALTDSMNTLRDHVEMSPAEWDDEMTEAALLFDDAQIAPPLAARLHAQFVRYTTQPADDATIAAWGVEARQALRERYGPEEAERRLDRAREFVANRPALRDALNATGVGSHPDVVLALTEQPNALRLTPRARRRT